MKPNSSTPTFAHTAIDNGSYVFMSEALGGNVNLDETPKISRDRASIKIDSVGFEVEIISIEIFDESSFTFCVEIGDLKNQIRSALLSRSNIVVSLDKREFNSQILKLELNNFYLRVQEK